MGIAHLVPLEARTRSRSEGNTATHLRRGIESGDDHPFMTAVCDVPGRLQSPASHRAQA